MHGYTMKSFDISRIEYYYENKISFRCIDIKVWCKENMKNEDFDIRYAANEIYNRYFSAKSHVPNFNYYYYIAPNSNSKYLYYLERDKILSPLENNIVPSKLELERYQSSIMDMEHKITFHPNRNKEDIEYIKSLDKLYRRRMRLIFHRTFQLSRYEKMYNREKYIALLIMKDRFYDLYTRSVMLDYIRQI